MRVHLTRHIVVLWAVHSRALSGHAGVLGGLRSASSWEGPHRGLADVNLVAGAEELTGDSLAVDEGAVTASEVLNAETLRSE